MIKIHSLPADEPVLQDVEVMINGNAVPVYTCRVSAVPYNRYWPGYQRSLDQTELAGFVSMDMSETGRRAAVSVKVNRVVNEVWLRPLSKNVRVSRGLDGIDHSICNEVNFNLDEPGQYVLEMDNHHEPIMFFVNPMAEYDVDIEDEDTLYFGPGAHFPGEIHLKSNQTLFVDKGAVVHTSITAENARNIRILGGGVIDNSSFKRSRGSINVNNPLILHDCVNVEIRDVIFRDSSCFTVMGFNLCNVTIENIKIIGNWRYNSDGIDLFNSQNVLVKNCFVRTYDDSIVIKGQKPYDHTNCENWLVTGCVVWCDWGTALELGADTRADEYRNIIFRDCDVVHNTSGAMRVHNNGDALCHGILFDNIRVEYKKSVTPTQFQENDETPYNPESDPVSPLLMAAIIPDGYGHQTICGPDAPYGSIRNVTFRNIYVNLPEGLPMPPSTFFGHGENEDVRDVRIEGLYVNGRHITTPEEANLQIGKYASDIILC